MAPSNPEQRTPPPPPHRVGGHYREFLALLLALVVGGIVGGALVAIYSGSDQVAVPAPSMSASARIPTVPSTHSAGPSPSKSANVQLSLACVRVINDARDAYTALGNLESVATSLNATKLDVAIRQVQEIRRRLTTDLPGCHAGIQLPNVPISPAPSVTATTG